MKNDKDINSSLSEIKKVLTEKKEVSDVDREKSDFYLLKDVIKKEGPRFLWKGNYVNLVKGTPQYTLNYMLFKELNKSMESKLISGAASGCISMSIIYPLETTRTFLSLQTNKNKYKGF